MALRSGGSGGAVPLFRFVLLCFVLLLTKVDAQQVLFQESFNVGSSWPLYERFIKSIRGKPALSEGGFTHDLPILPGQDEPPTKFFEVELSLTESGITKIVTVKVRGDNLYLIGYKPGDPATGKWFELKGASATGRQVIPGSTVLRFSGDYGALERASGKGRRETSLGRDPLKNALYALDKAAVTEREQAAAILVLVQMVCEAIRFRAITSDITAATNTGFLPNLRFIELENNWSALSKALQLTDRDPNARFPIQVPNNMNINNFLQAADALGVVLKSTAATATEITGGAVSVWADE